MGAPDLLALLPQIIIAAAVVLILVGIAIRRSYLASFLLALLGFAAAFISLFTLPDRAQVGQLLVVDTYARFFIGVILAANGSVLLLSLRYFRGYTENREELFVLLLLESLGAMVLVESSHFASFFLGLELLSVSLYAMLAYVRTRRTSIEAGLKYFVPAAVSSAFLLFGMALLYGETGTMEFAKIGAALTSGVGVLDPGPVTTVIMTAGLVMIIVAIGFKLALVPFHMWAADVYQGSAAPVTASIATVSKIAVFALFFRFFAGLDLHASPVVAWVLTIVAVLSMIGGSWLALRQTNVKRMLAYSSTAHLGYLMVPLLVGGVAGASASAFYLVAYSITTIGLFGVVSVLSGTGGEAERLEDYAGLSRRRPLLAVVLTVMLLSIAGIPLTAGFMGKLYLLGVGVGAGRWLLAASLVASSAIGLYYYLRVVAIQFSRASTPVLRPDGMERRADAVRMEPAASAVRAAGFAQRGGAEEEPSPEAITPFASGVGAAAGIILAVASLVVIGLGVFPSPLMLLIGRLVPAM